MPTENVNQHLSDEDRRDFLKTLGVAGAAATGSVALDDVTLGELRDAVTVESAGEFARRGEAIRNDLTGELDSALLGTELAGVADAMDTLAEVRAAGIPARNESLYAELTGAAWRIDDHLTEVGFYDSAEANLPRFSADHIEAMARQLVHAELLESALSDVGFDGRELTAVVANVVNQADRLALWEPTWVYEAADVEEINPDYVPPLQKRAAAGSLVWIDGLDKHLWQNNVLITDEMLDAAVTDVRAMLGGIYLLSAATKRLGRDDISDAELTALVSGSTAIMIASQTDLQYDVVRITDDMRAPRRGR